MRSVAMVTLSQGRRSRLHCKPPWPLRGLSLVEVSVVLAVTALVVALAMPALALARRKGQAVQCINNLRQIGVAMDHYRADQSDCIPAPLEDPSTKVALQAAALGRWSVLPAAWAQGRPRTTFVDYCEDGRVMTCPTVTDVGRYSYGLNGQVVDKVPRFRYITKPVEIPMVFDADKAKGYNYSDLRTRHTNCANVLFADFHVGLQAFQGLESYSQAASLPGCASNMNEWFTLSDGVVTTHRTLNATILVLGASFQSGNTRLPVASYYQVNKDSAQLITNDSFYGGSVYLENLQEGDTISIIGRASGATYRSDGTDGHCWSLVRGDTVPSLAGFSGQPSIEAYLQNYVDAGGHVSIGSRSVIYLFEMSSSTNWQRDSWADFQDLVVLVTFDDGQGAPQGPGPRRYDIDVRIAGTPAITVDVALLQGSVQLGACQINRAAGNPNDQVVTLGSFSLNPAQHVFTVAFTRIDGSRTGAGNPLWLRINGGNWMHAATLNRQKPSSSMDITAALASSP